MGLPCMGPQPGEAALSGMQTTANLQSNSATTGWNQGPVAPAATITTKRGPAGLHVPSVIAHSLEPAQA